MTFAQSAGLLLALTATFAYINVRFVRLPGTIGVMLLALVASLLLLLLAQFGLPLARIAQTMLGAIEFNNALMNGMLGFLLFAGALHVNLNDLAQQKWPVAFLAIVGVVISTFLVGIDCIWRSP